MKMDLSEVVDMRIVLISFILTPVCIGAVTTVTGYSEQAVQIRCPYETGYETHRKYLCRGACTILSLTRKDIPVQSDSAKDQRFSLDDDRAARVFTVTITDLRSEDAGTYWCAIERTLRDLYTAVELVVETQMPSKHPVVPPSTPAQTTAPCPESTRASSTTQIQTTRFLRTQFTAPTMVPLWTRSTHVSPSNMSSISMLSVCLPLVLSGLVLASVVLYCKWRRTTCTLTDAYVLTRTHKGTTDDEDGNHYESDLPGMSHVYQNLKPDTSQSNSVYQSLQLETKESDSIYQTLTPQTQSDTIYKVQNPTLTKHNRAQSTIV